MSATDVVLTGVPPIQQDERTTLGRMLKYPHRAVFDKAPDGELAFRLRHTNNAKWSIADGVLTATAGALEVTHDLTTVTVSQLVGLLVADGFEVLAQAAQFSSKSALVLVEGDGDQLVSNGDHIYGYRSILWAIFGGYAGEIRAARYQVQQALRQMVITTSEGEWLDLWGTLYAASRLPGESDAAYAVRVPQEAFRLRCNPHAIEKAILDATGYDVRIHEPWRDIFTLDESTLSGPAKMYDGERVGYHLIEPITTGYVDWPAVLAVINRNRPAGIEVLGPRLIYSVEVDGTGATADSRILSDSFSQSVLDDRALLDTGPLEDVSVPNYASLHTQERLHVSGSTIPVQTWGEFGWESVSWESLNYVVDSYHWRDYRVFFSEVNYLSQYWDVAARTWDAAPAVTWGEMNPIIESGYARES